MVVRAGIPRSIPDADLDPDSHAPRGLDAPSAPPTVDESSQESEVVSDVSSDETSPWGLLERTPSERSLSSSPEPPEEAVVSLTLDDGAWPGVEGWSPQTVGEPERKPDHGDAKLAAVFQPRNTRKSVTDDDGGEPKRKGLTSKQWLLCISALSFCWMLVTTFAAPPLGANSGKGGEMCVGTPTAGKLCLCPRDGVRDEVARGRVPRVRPRLRVLRLPHVHAPVFVKVS